MKRKLYSLIGAVTFLTACGSGTEPFGMLGDPTATPQMSLPFPSGTGIAAGGFAIYTPTVDGFEFLPNVPVGTSTNVVAPVTGTVASIVADTSTNPNQYSVTLLFNSRFSSRISKMGTPTVQVGKFVTPGTVIGTTIANVPVHFSVLRDGVPVCPLGYLDSTTLATIENAAQVLLAQTSPCTAP